MKKILLFLFALSFGAPSFAQDPNLYRTWHLYELAADLSPSEYVSNVQPSIHPYLTIHPDLSFEGYGACNNFMGQFTYTIISGEETLTPTFFDATLNSCNYQSHTNFESLFFGYVSATSNQYITLYYDANTSIGTLNLEFAPGFYAAYGTEALSVSDQNAVEFTVFPNPASEQLVITSENLQIETITIYEVSGKIVTQFKTVEGSVDVSSLSEGVYFIEINSEEGKHIKKFIKD
ncbi:T9SS type A sorting domain-containing protein [Ulvibacter litoralis]|uniref:Por secretion system C-terminal sorting domain-containing protein n=1 Tax=Ulvibacter litoralis TaxID=227084 RepID=A0A1G7DM17_9FLAO|nr:T9SS type A sorting domain-containing protein [Ulvibacter litoralis]GHC42966.1 hypothetical protein GCM10008083_01530 [Ulvibacter litoralis]SDE52548.1 Por secretion system C-terminal sorting domain-containing protein [Ulvibacter litoralis]